MNLVIKLVLSLLLVLCLLDMPYSYYQFVRFASFLGFGILAIDAQRQQKVVVAFVFVALALLFQPFLKVSFGRTLWNIVDFIVAAGLVYSIFKEKSNQNLS